MSRQIVDDWFNAFREKDITILERVLADDFSHFSPFGEVKGGQVYLDLVRDNADAFFSPTLDILDVIEGDDSFAVRYLVDGRPACDCIYISEGAITQIHSYYHVGKYPNMYDTWLE